MNIEGHLCYRVQNAVKEFCKPFEKHLINLWCGIHKGTKFNADIKAPLVVGFALQETIRSSGGLVNFWLTTNNIPMYDASFLLYNSWMRKEDQAIYRDDRDLIFDETALLKKPKSQLFLFKLKWRRKDLVKKGKFINVYKKVIFQNHKTLLIPNLYEAVFPMIKSFTVIFEQKTPQVHKLHLKLLKVTGDFLPLF